MSARACVCESVFAFQLSSFITRIFCCSVGALAFRLTIIIRLRRVVVVAAAAAVIPVAVVVAVQLIVLCVHFALTTLYFDCLLGADKISRLFSSFNSATN